MNDAELLVHRLQGLGAEIITRRVDTPTALTAALDERTWHIVISDYRMPKFSGMAALRLVRERSKELPFIIVSSNIGEDLAVEAMRAGANDYVMKGNLARLLPAVQRELNEAKSLAEHRAARKAQQEQLNFLAYYDPITGLANRSLFLERLKRRMQNADESGHRLAVGLIDIERFKSINDSVGQAAGDALLRQVAAWLTNAAGGAEFLARVGADIFAIMLPRVRPEGDVTHLFEKQRAAFLAYPFQLNDAVFRIGFKGGGALFPDDATDADALLKDAEAALKQAKTSGEPYLFYTPSMTANRVGKLTLENKLRQALDRNEFVLHYQPKVNLASGKLTSAEALIRWQDPRTGLVPPDRFIPILEETALIHEVGRWALRQAVADYLHWRNNGLPAVRIAVNVSPLQLRHRGFVAEVRDVISIDARAAEGLELEITESLIMEDVKHSIAALKAIRDMGVTIAIDDFGTGYSSLSYLAKLPVDTLKIDRSFVVEMTASPEGLTLVSTIVTLAHSLKLKVVAEGVETAEQAHLLRSLASDEMQGYLCSKPLPRAEFETKFLMPVTSEAGIEAYGCPCEATGPVLAIAHQLPSHHA